MSAIPEGFIHRFNKELVQFLFISISSAEELRSHFYVAPDRKYVTQEIFSKIYQQAEKVAKLRSNMISYLLQNINPL